VKYLYVQPQRQLKNYFGVCGHAVGESHPVKNITFWKWWDISNIWIYHLSRHFHTDRSFYSKAFSI